MTTEMYYRLSRTTGVRSDEHTSCMSKWVKEKLHDPETKKQCLKAAVKFKKALEAELNYLRSRPHSPRVEARISHIRDYMEMVERDIALLDNHRSH